MNGNIYETQTYWVFKRAMDILVSLIAIIVLSPMLLLIAIRIKLDSKGLAIFTQTRVGKGTSHFKIYKFRTMKTDAPQNMPTHLFENPEDYLTSEGKRIRRKSFDELPQLFNIFKGDMSFVGPRPALWNQYDLIAERDKYGANDIRPGLTGLAQINGRDILSIEDKARCDGLYVEKVGFLTDMYCLYLTARKTVSAEGVFDCNHSLQEQHQMQATEIPVEEFVCWK